MYLSIMAQRLVMSDPFDFLRNRFTVYDSALFKTHIRTEPVFYDTLNDFELYLTHKLYIYIPVCVNADAQLCFFFFKFFETRQHGVQLRSVIY